MKSFMFSTEEINLMCIFTTSSKTNMLKDLRESLRGVRNPELREIYESTIGKLDKISETDFTEIGLYTADEIDGEE